MLRALLASVLALPLAAQIPFGHLVVAHRIGSTTNAGVQVLDPASGALTPLYQPGQSLAIGGARTVAIDPANPNVIYSVTTLSISIAVQVLQLNLTGNEFTRTNVTVAGMPAPAYHLRWAQGFGLLLMGRGGLANRMFLRDLNGTVHSEPGTTLLPNLASDLAFQNGVAYATSEGDGTTVTNGTIVAWDLGANTDRVLGNSYPPLCSLAVFAGQLLAGDDVGNLWLIDPNTGGSALFLPTGLGRIVSLAVDTLNNIFLVANTGSTYAVYSMLDLQNPLYSTSTAIIEDLEFGPSPVPTLLTFGTGCAGSNQLAPKLPQGAVPTLGGTFTPQLNQGLPQSAAVLVLGLSRSGDGLGPLPRALDPIGMPGCSQYAGAAALLFAPTDAGGNASVSLALPANPALAGLQPVLQWLVLDAQANALGVTTSNGAEAFPR